MERKKENMIVVVGLCERSKGRREKKEIVRE
jgi:hypothetical protein